MKNVVARIPRSGHFRDRLIDESLENPRFIDGQTLRSRSVDAEQQHEEQQSSRDPARTIGHP
jgi:hypothetical protein